VSRIASQVYLETRGQIGSGVAALAFLCSMLLARLLIRYSPQGARRVINARLLALDCSILGNFYTAGVGKRRWMPADG
jgi:hypothetical protein